MFKRWIPFGLLSSHSRLHGNVAYRVPWLFDDEAVDVLRKFTRLKLSLMPYLYQAARVAHVDGVPVLRASVPLLVRPGAVVPVGAVADRRDYNYADGVTLRAYELPDGASVTTTIPTAAGDVACTFTTVRRGDTVHVSVDHPPARWRFQLDGTDPVDTTGAALTLECPG